MLAGKDPAAQEPQDHPPQMSRAGPATLAPMQQRPTLEPLGNQPMFPALSKPRLPVPLPLQANSTTPSQEAPQLPAAAVHSGASATADKAMPSPPPSALADPLPSDTREPASIEGLGSPATAERLASAAADVAATPPAAAAIASAAPAAGGSVEPSAEPLSTPGQLAQEQLPSQSTAAAQPVPLPLRDSPGPEPGSHTPTLPGAVPTTPTGAEAQTRAQVQGQQMPAGDPAAAAAAAAGMGLARVTKREPPKEPPPKAAVEHVSVTTDGRSVEQYIPFGFVELRGKLFADFPHVFSDPGVAKKFTELCKWISLRNSLRLALDYGDADEKYAPLDPDKDTLAFKVAAAGTAEGEEAAPPPKALSAAAVMPAPAPANSLVPKRDLKFMVEDLYGELDRILQKAEFVAMPPDVLENAKNHKSLMGVEVIPASEDHLEYRLHYRGTRTKKIQFRRWGLFKRQIEMSVYERLAVCFRLKKPVNADDTPEEVAAAAAADSNSIGFDTRPWYRKLFCGRRASVAPALRELRDEFVYMKLFKDVLQSDVDMLLPGAVIKFTWFDYVMIWVPILVGCGMAVWKAINGTIDFSNLMNAALSIVLIVMPITWGVRAYFDIKEKERLHQAHLNALFLMHNLNNNAGVISQLLDEAQEQEDNETMLAYFFLWQGEATPKPMLKLELDRAVEAYLQRKLDDLNVAIRMDYEILDSITKLERLGLIYVSRGEDGARRLQALPLDLALEKAHVRYFDESREAGQPDLPALAVKHQTSMTLAWHECMDIFGPTGQKFRYFWNAQTGESQYHEPDEPYIKLGASDALDLEDAHGILMSDPKKQPTLEPTPLHHAKTA